MGNQVTILNQLRDLALEGNCSELSPKLQALYKQATVGDCKGEDPKQSHSALACMKPEVSTWKHWMELKGMSKEEAEATFMNELLSSVSVSKGNDGAESKEKQTTELLANGGPVHGSIPVGMTKKGRDSSQAINISNDPDGSQFYTVGITKVSHHEIAYVASISENENIVKYKFIRRFLANMADDFIHHDLIPANQGLLFHPKSIEDVIGGVQCLAMIVYAALSVDFSGKFVPGTMQQSLITQSIENIRRYMKDLGYDALEQEEAVEALNEAVLIRQGLCHNFKPRVVNWPSEGYYNWMADSMLRMDHNERDSAPSPSLGYLLNFVKIGIVLSKAAIILYHCSPLFVWSPISGIFRIHKASKDDLSKRLDDLNWIVPAAKILFESRLWQDDNLSSSKPSKLEKIVDHSSEGVLYLTTKSGTHLPLSWSASVSDIPPIPVTSAATIVKDNTSNRDNLCEFARATFNAFRTYWPRNRGTAPLLDQRYALYFKISDSTKVKKSHSTKILTAEIETYQIESNYGFQIAPTMTADSEVAQM